MLKKDEIYEIQIVDMGNKGEAIGKTDGFTVFVDGAVKGDLVKGRITLSKKNYAVADLVEIVTPSEDRVTPRCELSGICGGCQIMHMDYKKQLEMKSDQLRQSLVRIGKIENPNLLPIIGMEDPYNYRNKAQFPLEIDSKGNLQIGFYKKFSHNVIPFDTCHIQDPINDKILKVVKEYIAKNEITIYDEKTNEGNIKRIVTKVGFKTGEVMVVIVTKGKILKNNDQLVSMLKKEVPGLTTVVQNINSKQTNVILGHKNFVLYGTGTITDKLHDLVFEISPNSFYQVNPVQTDVLYSKALEFADIDSTKTVVDVYCGIGTISLFLAQKAKKVIGIEVLEESIEDAKRNAEINKLSNAEFLCGKAEEVLPKLYEEGIRADVVVVDPPRKGCEEIVLKTIAEMNVEKIVYISCNPSTLARDIEILSHHGYKMEKVQGVDMFPHSMHIESVTLLVKKV
ncbi:23S rRNA (uracil(1939)-C(5))-methyltransferase RlmD [Proteocatella sphenisci]|uniref:23S rRNA (uracil(1939)-C(5))-methyltransferase RlmD n=1 Tax=Proteocatella sphenisci TaxID=181070 RepID=UPI0004906DDD|nr:23S rRNA (uracil(1939)-C(5))-methyltransferase RlmD [Proteocatella sphenisci]